MKITIPGNPISKSRHRCGCKDRHPFSYDPQVRNEMAYVKTLMLQLYRESIRNSQIDQNALYLTNNRSYHVSCVFGFMTPRSLSLGQKNALLWGFEDHISKPDLDNLLKLYWDCGTGIFWDDDCKISIQSSRKIYVENPFVEIDVVANKELNITNLVRAVLTIISPTQLLTLISDAKALADIDSLPEIDWKMNLCANVLSTFAKKHAKILTKIAKIND